MNIVDDSCDFYYGQRWGWFLLVAFRGENCSIYIAEGKPVSKASMEFLNQHLKNWFVADDG